MIEIKEEKIIKLGGKSFFDYIKKYNIEFPENIETDEFDNKLTEIYKKYKQQKMIDIDSTRMLC